MSAPIPSEQNPPIADSQPATAAPVPSAGSSANVAAGSTQPTARSYASATKKVSSPPIASSATPPVAVGGSQNAQHGKSASVSPVNGKNPIQPAVPAMAPTIANSSAFVSAADHNRKSSVTIPATGPSGYVANSGTTASRPPSGIQFGAMAGSPAASHAAPHQSQGPSLNPQAQNPRVASPAHSPSPIPQYSGGKPNNLRGGGRPDIAFGAGETAEQNNRPMINAQPNALPAQAQHYGRRESHGEMGNPPFNQNRGGFQPNGGGRGGRNNFQPGFHPQHAHPQQSPSMARTLPYQPGGRPGGPAMAAPFVSQNRAYPNSPYQANRSPHLATATMHQQPHIANGQPMPFYPQHPPQPVGIISPNSQTPSLLLESDHPASLSVSANVSQVVSSTDIPQKAVAGLPKWRLPLDKGNAFVQQISFQSSHSSSPSLTPSASAYKQYLTELDTQGYGYVPPPMEHYPYFTQQGYPPHSFPVPGSPSRNPAYPYPVQGAYGMPAFVPPQHAGGMAMSRSPSQVSERPPSAAPQPSTPAMTNVNQVSHTPTPSMNASPGPHSHNFVPPKKKSTPIVIKRPDTNEVVTFDQPSSSPAPPAPPRSPAIVSTPGPTPPPRVPSAAGSSHSRAESTPSGGKSAEEKREEFMKQVQSQIAGKEGQADSDKKAEEQKKAEQEKKEEAEKKAEQKRKAEEQKKAEDEKKAEAEAKEKAAQEEADKAAKEEAERAAKEKEAEEARLREEEEERMIAEMEAKEREEEERERQFAEKRKAEAEAKKAKEAEEKAREDERLREQERLAEELEEKKRAKGEQDAESLALFASLKKNPFGPHAGADTGAPTAPVEAAPSAEAAATAPPAAQPKAPSAGRPRPANLRLETTKNVEPPQPSAAMQSLKSARFLQVRDELITYPDGIKSPNPALNMGSKKGKQYDKDFLLQFQEVFKEKPSPDWELKLKELVGDSGESRPQSARTSMGPRQPSKGGVPPMGNFGNFASGRTIPPGTTSEMRFQAATQGGRGAASSISNPLAPYVGNRPGASFPMARSGSFQNISQAPSSPRVGSSRGRGSRRGDKGPSKKEEEQLAKAMPLTANLAPEALKLERSQTGWKPQSLTSSGANAVLPSGHMPPDMVQRKVKAALNKMTPENFSKIADQIQSIAAQSKDENDGRTLRQVIQLTFEKACDEAHWAGMYAKFAEHMLTTMSPEIKDETVRDKKGDPVVGGALFRKYLLNRCQEEFERGWTVNLPEKPEGQSTEAALLSDEYYVAAAAKRKGLGLVQFIGELYKLKMLTLRIMHECIMKLLDFEGLPDEASIESLVKLLRTVGSNMQKEEAGPKMLAVYFERIEMIMNMEGLPSRLKFMLLDVVDLRKANWVSKDANKGPKTIAQIHEEEAAARQAAEMERARTSQRGGPRPPIGRGDARSFSGGGMMPPQDYRSSQIQMDDLRKLSRGASGRNMNASGQLGPSLLGSRSSSRRGLGPGGLIGRGDESGASSRTATPPQKEKESTTHVNSFSALAALENEGTLEVGSPPSTASSPPVQRAAPATDGKDTKPSE